MPNAFFVSNGYGSYRNFLTSSFDPQKIVYGGPDFRGGSDVYTLAFTVVAPTIEPLLNFANALDKVAKTSSDLINTVYADAKSGFEQKAAKIAEKERYPLEGLVKADKPIVTLNDQTLTVNSFKYYVQLARQIEFAKDSKVFNLEDYTNPDTGALSIRAAGNISGYFFLEYATSYVVYLDTQDTSSDNIKFELLEKSSKSENKIDVLATLKPVPSTESIVAVFQAKLMALKNARKIPLAIFVTKCSPLQTYYLEALSGTDIKGNTDNTLIPLDTYAQSTVQSASENPLTPELLWAAQLFRDAVVADVPQTSTSSWNSVALSALPGLAPALATLRQIKTATQSNKLSSEKGIVKQINTIIDALLKYIALIEEFLRQIKILTSMLTSFFEALDALRVVNIYTLMVLPPMGAVGSTEELRDILLAAKGLPQQEDLNYASLITVFSVPTPQAISNKLGSAYGIPDGEPLPSYLNEKARLVSKEMPSAVQPLSDLLDLLKKNGLLK